MGSKETTLDLIDFNSMDKNHCSFYLNTLVCVLSKKKSAKLVKLPINQFIFPPYCPEHFVFKIRESNRLFFLLTIKL